MSENAASVSVVNCVQFALIIIIIIYNICIAPYNTIL